MNIAAPSLLELQRALRSSIVGREDGGLSAHVIDAEIGAAERLDIYRNTFASVLTTALRLSYPAVHRLVGAEFFDGAARIFIQTYPPAVACLDDYGAEFADFLSGFGPASSLSYLPDVARLEWAVSRALHARDADPLDVRKLAALTEADRARVSFAPHPSVNLVRSWHPADLIWRAVLDEDDAALSAIDPAAGPVWLLVRRRAAGIDVRSVNERAWRFTSALCAGMPLAAAFDVARDLETSGLLADHLATGLFVDFDLR